MIPAYLRSKGIEVITIMEEFGRQDVQDIEWIEAAGRRGWIVFTKDAHIRSNLSEREAVIQYGLRVVCLVKQGICFEDMVNIFDINWKRLEKWFGKPGPWMIALRRSSIEKVDLKRSRS
jgi:predicted nuclease of predicted toxin-antitoxin system